MSKSAILLVHCKDQPGIVATLSSFIRQHQGNILYLDQHVDRSHAPHMFFLRIEWDLTEFDIPPEKVAEVFESQIGRSYAMHSELYFSDERPRMAVFVSKYSHCLSEILARIQSEEWPLEIPCIISNHPDLKKMADQTQIPYHVFAIDENNKQDQEEQELRVLKEAKIDFVVLARYMQQLSPLLVNAYPGRIINIHHSFLPAFPGAKPYHSAHDRGVKIIGATSHYVTEDIDAGPIIEQDVIGVSSKDSVEDFIRKGRDLEKIVLSRAIWQHLQRKTLIHKNRVINFE